MTIACSGMPGYRVNQYRLIMLPQESMAQKILQLRRAAANYFPEAKVLMNRPYIGLADFMQYEMMEERLQYRLRCIAMEQQAFRLRIQGWELTAQQSLTLHLPDAEPIMQLVAQIRFEARRLMKLNDQVKPHFAQRPSLPIIHQIPEQLLGAVEKRYARKKIEGSLTADAMLLLKRPQTGELGKLQRAMIL